MALPKKKVSKARRNSRRANWKLSLPGVVECPKCKEPKLAHRVCKACGASFHVVNIPPKKEGVCDYCGGELIQRADDNLETVTNRIDVYEAQTKPLIDYYEKAGNIAHIDGTTGLDNVFADIVKALGE